MLSADAKLARKLEALEKRYDAQFRVVFDAIRELMAPRVDAEATNRFPVGTVSGELAFMDLVLLLEGAADANTAAAVVVEAQLGSTRIWSSRRSMRRRVLFWRHSWRAGTTSTRATSRGATWRRARREGRAEGEAAGLARALYAVLAARGLEIPEEVRARIAACTDLVLLDRWLARAVTARAAADVVSE